MPEPVQSMTKSLPSGEAFGQEEARSGFIEQDGVALFHGGKPRGHGASFDQDGKIFERVGVFGGHDGIRAPDKAFAVAKPEPRKLSCREAVGFRAADGKSHQFGRMVFNPQDFFFGKLGFGRGCHNGIPCVCGMETEGIIPVRLAKGRLKTRLSGFQTTFYTERKLKIYG